MNHQEKDNILKLSYAILFIMAGTFLFLKLFGVSQANESISAAKAFALYQQREVVINDHVFNVYVADTPEKQSRGLSNITSMFPEEGMLFIFSSPDIYKFWMKEMDFNLDFVWIRDGKIVDLTENVSSELIDQLNITSPKEPASQVLELNAGQIELNGLKVGQEVVVR